MNEELHELGIGRVMRQNPLDDDEPLAARVLGQENLGHTAEGEGPEDLVATKVIHQSRRLRPSCRVRVVER